MDDKIWLVYTDEGLTGYCLSYQEAEDFIYDTFVVEKGLHPATVVNNREITFNIKFGNFELMYNDRRQPDWYFCSLERL